MQLSHTAAVAAILLTTTLTATAAGPGPDPPPEAHGKKATVSGSFWIDLPIYVNDQLVHGAKGRCHYRVHYARRCFIIRVRVR